MKIDPSIPMLRARIGVLEAELAESKRYEEQNHQRIRELEESLAKYQTARVHDVDEKAWLSKRMSEMEAALRSSPCPRPLDGEDTVELCIKAGHCGCDNKAALQSEMSE